MEVRAERVQFLGSGGAGSAGKPADSAEEAHAPLEEKVDGGAAFGSGSDEVSWGQDMAEDTN